MGLFGPNRNSIQESYENDFQDVDMQKYISECIFDELSGLPDERKQEFINSNEAAQMIEEGLIGKNTLVRLSKTDDLSRRIKLAALQLAEDKEDKLFEKWQYFRSKVKEYEDKIADKYSMKSTRMAKIAQRDYLKNNKISSAFMRK